MQRRPWRFIPKQGPRVDRTPGGTWFGCSSDWVVADDLKAGAVAGSRAVRAGGSGTSAGQGGRTETGQESAPLGSSGAVRVGQRVKADRGVGVLIGRVPTSVWVVLAVALALRL